MDQTQRLLRAAGAARFASLVLSVVAAAVLQNTPGESVHLILVGVWAGVAAVVAACLMWLSGSSGVAVRARRHAPSLTTLLTVADIAATTGILARSGRPLPRAHRKCAGPGAAGTGCYFRLA